MSLIKKCFFISFLCFHLTYAYSQESADLFLQVIGISQDGGYPHAGCNKKCCNIAWEKSDKHFVTSLVILDMKNHKAWLIDCSPDFKEQWHLIQQNSKEKISLEGIFLSHAHIGHYLGLADLGREVMGTKGVKVYTMPKMKIFLENNGPWDQLVTLGNIELIQLQAEESFNLNASHSLTPFLVPHRDEYSETVGFTIRGKNKNVLFIPDIDKWQKWDLDITEQIKMVDVAYIDATFYDEKELPNRDMQDIPHPFVVESIELFKDLNAENKAKVRFIHMNHSNPLQYDKRVQDLVRSKGFNIAEQGEMVEL